MSFQIMEDDYGKFYSKNGGDRMALRAGRFGPRRKHTSMPYKLDREGDAQMGDGPPPSTSTATIENREPRSMGLNPGMGRPTGRGRSTSVTIPAKGDVFSRLGARPGRESFPVGARGRERPRIIHHGGRRPVADWFKIKLLGAAQVDRNWVMKSLQDQLTIPLTPVQVVTDGNSLVFHVNSRPLSEQLRGLHRVLTFPTGSKIAIQVNNSQAPTLHLDDNVKEKIKSVMASRYNPAMKFLDLRNFAEDAEFKKDNLSVHLTRRNIMTAVVDLIISNVSDLQSLDLSGNKINELNAFATLGGKIPLKTLNLSDNVIPRVYEIDRLKTFTSLTDLDLSRNPARGEYRDNSSYVENVRKRLPNLLRLDGVLLPKKIGFDAPVRAALPVPTPFHVPNEEAKQQLTTFVQQFFQCYDTQRNHLTAAYAVDGQFSYQYTLSSDRTSAYQSGRNLQFIEENSWRTKRLHIGPTNIVSFFNTLPSTAHLFESFTMDVFFNENSLVGFAVAGLFREDYVSPTKKGTLRSFCRNFVVRIDPNGLSIISDTLSIASPTLEQMKQFGNVAVVKPESIPHPSASHAQSPQPTSSHATDDSMKELMVAQFARESGMNLHFSRMALDDNGWDYAKAATVFTELRSQNKLPAEAFVK
ncbi:hypothetical protein RvY_09548 [Ramazzottius varieornatus]|uniref:Nuclear RNA export factor 1 n=1 Tax=Ramazzottius varieornatus TaxID=947166 RepID=A0A1D1V9T7_RAMVA|nr:hypothetical protein RvY_09548 [Ramazzottius varieornatus]